MSAQVPVRPGTHQEVHSALNWPLLTCGLFVPLTAEITFLILGILITPLWFIAVLGLPVFAPVLVYTSLLYRNWPTGIRIGESAISVGAVGSARAAGRRPTVSHQSWGVYTCPWLAVENVRIVTGRAELRRLKTSARYYTLNNRWGSPNAMTHCNIGVLTSPFMRAALVIEVDPFAVTFTPVRPARFYSNFKFAQFSRLLQPELSSTWIAPTRDPEALRKALEDHPNGANLS